MRNTLGLMVVVASAALVALGGCGSDKPAQEPSAMTPPPPPPPAPMPESKPATTDTKPIEGMTGGGPSSSMGGEATPAPSPPPAPKPLTDGEIVAVTSTANKGEIEMAQLATKTSTNPEVKNYAAMMLSQHRDMETKGKSLAAKAKITPEDNDASKALKTDVDSSLTSLKGQKGKDFDKAYMESQVKAHREVLDVIDNKLLPSAQNGDLKTMLTDARSHVASHLAKAEEIQQKLETAPAKPGKPAPKK